MTTTNTPRPERTFTPEQQQAMYAALQDIADHEHLLDYCLEYTKSDRILLNIKTALAAIQKPRKLLEEHDTLQALDAPQTAGTGRYVVKPVLSGRYVVVDTANEDFIMGLSHCTLGDANDAAAKLNAQRSADTGDESEGAK